ncbi:MAG: hypothetical protein HYS18_08075 [Burkholderiales bacterium]|nr:hypothetical protein [Burkholderiales bacterium]
MNMWRSVFAVALLVNLSVAVAANRDEFKKGLVQGCSENAMQKGNTSGDAAKFCDCYAGVIAGNASDAEYSRMLQDDQAVVMAVIKRNMDKLQRCEKRVPNLKL